MENPKEEPAALAILEASIDEATDPNDSQATPRLRKIAIGFALLYIAMMGVRMFFNLWDMEKMVLLTGQTTGPLGISAIVSYIAYRLAKRSERLGEFVFIIMIGAFTLYEAADLPHDWCCAQTLEARAAINTRNENIADSVRNYIESGSTDIEKEQQILELFEELAGELEYRSGELAPDMPGIYVALSDHMRVVHLQIQQIREVGNAYLSEMNGFPTQISNLKQLDALLELNERYIATNIDFKMTFEGSAERLSEEFVKSGYPVNEAAELAERIGNIQALSQLLQICDIDNTILNTQRELINIVRDNWGAWTIEDDMILFNEMVEDNISETYNEHLENVAKLAATRAELKARIFKE